MVLVNTSVRVPAASLGSMPVATEGRPRANQHRAEKSVVLAMACLRVVGPGAAALDPIRVASADRPMLKSCRVKALVALLAVGHR